ncbi:DUF1833 family protein [Paracidovorax wautersii]|uniref:DUF1833 domain-containing protein n=1 Tax=Paracidovorax wautersii TaxID=1177982 RepID=A0A1I2E777_9BURK|nr:DUF1833 family protein [Paracidovorax wautersii]SFE88824.1 protein of unknown function [Paracidovorax wautersii]
MTALRTNSQRVTNPGGSMELLEIANPGFSEPMRICNDVEDVVSQNVPYIGIPFRFTLPEDVSGANPQLRLQLDNVGRGITDELERRQPGSVTMAKLIVVDRTEPDVHAHVYYLPLTNVSVTPTVATATASADYWMRQSACRQIADPHHLPGIF